MPLAVDFLNIDLRWRQPQESVLVVSVAIWVLCSEGRGSLFELALGVW